MDINNLMMGAMSNMHSSRDKMGRLVTAILPKDESEYDEDAKSIRRMMNTYYTLVGNLYTAVIHDKIANALVEYCNKHNLNFKEYAKKYYK